MQSDEPAEAGGSQQARLGVDLLLTKQVALKEGVSVRTVERWITEKGLPAVEATQEQRGQLYSQELLHAIPPHKIIYLIRKEDMRLIPGIRAYPTGTTRPRKGKQLGMGEA